MSHASKLPSEATPLPFFRNIIKHERRGLGVQWVDPLDPGSALARASSYLNQGLGQLRLSSRRCPPLIR
jgi:hypothetical protein